MTAIVIIIINFLKVMFIIIVSIIWFFIFFYFYYYFDNYICVLVYHLHSRTWYIVFILSLLFPHVWVDNSQIHNICHV